MSYIISATIVLVALLSFIALFGEAREAIKAGRRRSHKSEKEKLIAKAIGMNGQLHKIDPVSFQKLAIHVYTEIGYRVKILPVAKETVMILEQNGAYTLTVYKNHSWPMGQETLEIFYYHKTKMGLDAMMVISTGGFNQSALGWARDQHDVKLISEENFIELCQEIAAPLKKDATIIDPVIQRSRATLT